MGEAVRLVWIERLVDHVPHVDHAAEVLYFGLDVVLYPLRQQADVCGIRCGQRSYTVRLAKYPCGSLRARRPDQVVAADQHAVSQGKTNLRIGSGKGETAFLRLGGVPLHAVAGHDTVEMPGQ